MNPLVPEDRGLGTAYERYCWYQVMDAWKDEYGIETMLEGPIDGMAGVAGVHGVGLARRGVKVVSAVPTEAHAAVTRGVYATASAPVEVVVAGEDDVESLPRSDLVLCYHAFELVRDWRSYLARVASLARKVLVVAVCNPDNWGVALSRMLSRVKGPRIVSPEAWHTDVLAPELWALGRVKEHRYFDCPWWPDVPFLKDNPGEPFGGRIKGLLGLGGKRASSAAAARATYAYGPGHWPYFGGPGWNDELLPALLKHPCFEGARSQVVRVRSAHLHAFVVDMRPRTPKERRRLAQVDAGEHAK